MWYNAHIARKQEGAMATGWNQMKREILGMI